MELDPIKEPTLETVPAAATVIPTTQIAATEPDHTSKDQVVEDAQIIDTTQDVVPEKLTAGTVLAEAVFWNNTQNNLSIGMALLNKDQLHIAIHSTAKLPKDLSPEQAPGLVTLKPNEGMLFRMDNLGPVTVSEPVEAPADFPPTMGAA